MFDKSPLLILIFLIFMSFSVQSASKEQVFKAGNVIMLAPPLVNKDYFLVEYGFISEKKIKSWDYHYNAYVTAALYQDWLDNSNHLRAGGLGFKAGLMLPFQPQVPMLFTFSAGFAKTVLHKNPFLGRDHLTVAKKDMILLEAGLLTHYNNYFLRGAYQVSNVKYFKRHVLIVLGVTY